MTTSTRSQPLTARQNAVIYCLQNGWKLITSDVMKGAIVAFEKKEYRINGGLFWRLVAMGLIYQSGEQNYFCYTLTQEGEDIKTKPVKL